MINIQNLNSYYLHVITAHTMDETLGKFHTSSDYDLNALTSYYPCVNNHRGKVKRKCSRTQITKTVKEFECTFTMTGSEETAHIVL